MKKKRKLRPPHSEETKQKMRDAYIARIEAKKEKVMVEVEPEIKTKSIEAARHNRDILQEAVDWASGK